MSMDYSDFEQDIVAPSGDQLKSIEMLAQQAYTLQSTIDMHEAAVKSLKAELTAITMKSLPEVMAAAGTTSFTTTNGVKITIKEILNGTLPKTEHERALALKWLEENGGKPIIKGVLTAEFERGADNAELRNRAAEALAELKVNFVEQETVHPQTLAAFARERLKNGEEVPLDMLGLYAGRQAKITVA